VTATDIITVLEYAVKGNNPLVTIPVLFFIVFLGYCLAKKFFDTGYIATSKETREAQHQLNTELQQEIERLNKKVGQLINENSELKTKIAGLPYIGENGEG
jgi:peptidoglycan hydrolase CwlO-like protein